MKKQYLYVLMALSIAPNLSLAQGANIDAEVDQELDQMYSNQSATVKPRQAPAATANRGGQPIYILNQATPTSNATASAQNTNTNTSTQYQKQPVAVIESTPLVESKAEMMRKSRQDAEIHTEQKIVEKLEQSRLEDERRRADALFGNKLNQQPQQENTTTVITQPVQQAPAVVPVVVAPAEPKENLRDVVREELRNSMKVDKEDAVEESRYFSGLIGVGEYPDVVNVRGNYAVGAAFGNRIDQMLIEGTFMLSNYTVEQRPNMYSQYVSLIDTNQYQAGIAAKYQLMSGLVRPVVGGLASYSYRKFNWNNIGNFYGYSSTSDSHAIDLGVSAGVDLELSKKFALGFEYRYMFNLSSRVPNQAVFTGPQYGMGGTPIEKLSYYTLGLAAKVNF